MALQSKDNAIRSATKRRRLERSEVRVRPARPLVSRESVIKQNMRGARLPLFD